MDLDVLVSKSSLAQSNEVLERMTLKSPLVGFDSQISKDIEWLNVVQYMDALCRWTEVGGTLPSLGHVVQFAVCLGYKPDDPCASSF